VQINQKAIERVHALADTMARAVGEVTAGELVLAGVEIAVRALVAGGMSQHDALEQVELLARQARGR
jgi:hypothetical protein